MSQELFFHSLIRGCKTKTYFENLKLCITGKKSWRMTGFQPRSWSEEYYKVFFHWASRPRLKLHLLKSKLYSSKFFTGVLCLWIQLPCPIQTWIYNPCVDSSAIQFAIPYCLAKWIKTILLMILNLIKSQFGSINFGFS